MITSEAIKKFATKYQTTEANIRQEYVQHLFLSYFYQQPEARDVYFKGGTALRLVYKSPRFSEDLDFSASLFDAAPLEEAIINALQEIEREGIKVEIKESKKTTGGYLAILIFQIGVDTVTLQLEVSLRQGDKRGGVETISNDFIPSYAIVGLVKDQLTGEKIQALLARQKPRDFYDLYYLIRADMITQAEKKIFSHVMVILKTTKINFEQELKRFLPKTQWAVIKDFKNNLVRELGRYS